MKKKNVRFLELDDFYSEAIKYSSIRDMAKEIGMSAGGIFKYVAKLKRTYPDKHETLIFTWRNKQGERRVDRRKYQVNDSAFNLVNDDVAYWLGMIASDGCIHKKKNMFSIALKSEDRGQLEKLVDFLEYSGNIRNYYASCNKRKYPTVALEIYSKEIIKSLANYGIVPAKSNLDINYLSYIPDKFKFAFICGYLDGDGSILKNRDEKNPKRNPSFEILGNKSLVEDIAEYLRYGLGIRLSVNPESKSGSSYQKYICKCSNMDGCYKFFTKYVELPYVLERKRVRAIRWIECMDKIAN